MVISITFVPLSYLVHKYINLVNDAFVGFRFHNCKEFRRVFLKSLRLVCLPVISYMNRSNRHFLKNDASFCHLFATRKLNVIYILIMSTLLHQIKGKINSLPWFLYFLKKIFISDLLKMSYNIYTAIKIYGSFL